jgi:tetratricopeptide (TPR) repeat protein
MKREKRKKEHKATVLSKLSLIVFGIILCLFCMELVMRISGAAFFAVQDIYNKIDRDFKDNYIILCVGESITAFGADKSYPRQLETILNDHSVDKKFKVINKGVPATNSSAIYAQLPQYLEEYKPDIVTIMMGVNDNAINPVDLHPEKSSKFGLLQNLRVYKMFKHFTKTLHLKKKNNYAKQIEENRFYDQQTEIPITNEEVKLKQYLLSNPYDIWKYYDLSQYYMKAGQYEQAFPILLQAMNIDSTNVGVLLDLAICYKKRGDFESAQEHFKRVQQLYPDNKWAYLESGRAYMQEGQHEKAKQVYEQLIEIKPDLDVAYLELGNCVRIEGNYEKARKLVEKAIELNPNNDAAWLELGWTNKYLADYKKAKECMAKAIQLNKNNIRAYFSLGWLYINKDELKQAESTFLQALDIDNTDEQILMGLATCYMLTKEYDKAEEVYENILSNNPNNKKAFGGLALLYTQQGKSRLAKDYSATGNQKNDDWFTLTTQNNYKKMINLLNQKGITAVCVAYPNQTSIPLKHIFQDQNHITFVDNKKSFEQAIKKDGYAEYFIDTFAGDFGHCTAKGNRLLAENIAEAILKDARFSDSSGLTRRMQ